MSSNENMRKSLSQMLNEAHKREVESNRARIEKQALHPRRGRNIEPVRFGSLPNA